MSSYRVERLLPYRDEQLFDLAADVDRYPEFLRGWVAARIYKREANVWHVDQTVRFGLIRMRFGSKAVLHRPERLDVTSDEEPFRHFRLSWIFEPQPDGGCRVALVADVRLRSPLLQVALDLLLARIIADIMAAFERRAHQRCGRSRPPAANNT
jgi:coenzyme Q-binding protein COQ10